VISSYYEKFDDGTEVAIEIDSIIPEAWVWCYFSDIADVINGKNQSKVKDDAGKYPIYGSGGIIGYANDYICPKNCTIIGRKGSINNPIFTEEKFWNVDTAFGLAPSSIVLPRYLFYFCKSFDFTSLDSKQYNSTKFNQNKYSAYLISIAAISCTTTDFR